VLLALQEAPLKFKRVPVDRSNLLKLVQYGLDLLGRDGEQRVVGNLEAVDPGRGAIERHLDDHLQIELVLELNEEL
jgi:hypothetical protein